MRTIQRVETENLASPETRLALAAALDVPVAVLAPAPLATSDPPRASSSGLLQKAFLGLGLAFAVGFALVALFNLVSGIMPRG